MDLPARRGSTFSLAMLHAGLLRGMLLWWYWEGRSPRRRQRRAVVTAQVLDGARSDVRSVTPRKQLMGE